MGVFYIKSVIRANSILITWHDVFVIGAMVVGVGAVPANPSNGVCQTTLSLHVNLTENDRKHVFSNRLVTATPLGKSA